MRRRDILTGLVAVPFAAGKALGASTLSDLGAPTDPHPQWLAEHLASIDWLDAHAFDHDISDEALDRICDCLGEQRERIFATPAATPAGMAAQIRLFISMKERGLEHNPAEWARLDAIADALA